MEFLGKKLQYALVQKKLLFLQIAGVSVWSRPRGRSADQMLNMQLLEDAAWTLEGIARLGGPDVVLRATHIKLS